MADSAQSVDHLSSKKNVSLDAHETMNSISNVHDAESVHNDTGDRITICRTVEHLYVFFFFISNMIPVALC
jgi:hypothetical protein